MIIDELIAVLGYDIRGEAELKRFNAGMERTALLAQRMAAALVAAGTLAAGAMIGLGKSVIDTSAKFEGFQTSLETIEGSADKAKAAMDWITKFAATTPYEMEELTRAFIKLKSYGIDPLDGTMTTLGDTASAMNKPLDMAVEAFADATSFQFERLREFGVVATQKGEEVTFKWTKNGKAFTKTVKKNGADIQKFLKEHWGKSFSGAMVRQSKTWNGMMSNLSDSWEIFKKTIGDGGFFNNMKSRLAGLLDSIAKLKENGTLDKWAKGLSDGLTWGVDFAVGQIQGLIGDLKFLFGWIKMNPDWFQPIKLGLMAIGAVIFPKVAALLVLQDVLRFLQGKGSVIGDFAKSLSELSGVDAGAIGSVMAALAVGGAAFLLFGGTFGKIAGGIRALAIALGLMGGTQAVAGTAALGTLAGGSIAAGLLGIAAAAGAAAASVKLFYDAWKADKPLNDAIKDKIAPGALEWVFGELMGGNHDPKKSGSWQGPDWAGGQNKPTPGTGSNLKISPDLMDYKLQKASEETNRAKYANWGNMAENARMNSQRMGGGASVTNVNAPISTIVNLTVKMEQAAIAAGNAVRGKVAGALSGVSANSHPTRTTPSPTF